MGADPPSKESWCHIRAFDIYRHCVLGTFLTGLRRRETENLKRVYDRESG